MRKLITTATVPERVQRRFHSVAEAAQILGVSEMTLYRAIRTGQFPAVQLMGRLIIPSKVIDEMIDAAIESGALVCTEQWTPDAARPGQRD
jgi:excisionase family DNA binding protein